MQCYFTVNWDLEVLLLIHLIKYMRHQKNTFLITLTNVVDFQNSFSAEIGSKFATKK